MTFSVSYLEYNVLFFRFLVRSKICHVYSLRNFGRQFVSQCVKEHNRCSCVRSWRLLLPWHWLTKERRGKDNFTRREQSFDVLQCTVFIIRTFLAKTVRSESQLIITIFRHKCISVEDGMIETMNHSVSTRNTRAPQLLVRNCPFSFVPSSAVLRRPLQWLLQKGPRLFRFLIGPLRCLFHRCSVIRCLSSSWTIMTEISLEPYYSNLF